MKITNKYGVPDNLVTLASREYYTKGKSQYSVTELLSPPRIKRLREKFNENIEQDVSDMLWQMLGSALHVVFERSQTPGYVTEERVFLEVDGVTLSGQIDVQQETPDGVVLIDYKFTSAWAVMQDKVEWEEQLNVYAWLLQKVKGKPVIGLKICAMIRDFSRHDQREDYPDSPIHMMDIPLWDMEVTERFVKERLEQHQLSKMQLELGENLPRCSDSERWMSETVYAVKREGRKTAIRLFKTIEEANELAIKEKGYVETRLGEPRRCTGNFCGVSAYCDQYSEWVGNQPGGTTEPERQ